MPLDITQVRFGVSVAMRAAGLLGESAGRPVGDGCPQGDPDCYAGIAGDHQLCQYRLAPCDDPDDGCPADARAVGAPRSAR